MNIRQTIWRLQQTNEKAYYLAVLRVLLCLWFLKELLFRWPAFDMIYSNHSFLKTVPSVSLYFLHLDPYFLKEHYMLIVYACISLLLLNILGIGRNLVSVLLFLSLTLLYMLNNRYNNNGEVMALLLVFYLSLANTFSYYTLLKRKPLSDRKEKVFNLLSNLAAYSMMFNLSLVYFMAGVAKLQDPYWQQGMGIHYFLNDDRFFVFAGPGNHVEFPIVITYMLNYGIILLELIFPVLMWYKRCRVITFSTLFLMHLFIYLFLMIYGMSEVFVIQYGLFFSNTEVKNAAQKVKDLIWKKIPYLNKVTV